MSVVTWSPFREFEDLFNRYGRLNNGRLVRGESSDDARQIEWRPAANISETDSEYLIKAELPEVDKKDVEVSVHDGIISIKGERRLEKTDDSEQTHRIEFCYGSFARSFSLPADVDDSKINAESKDGVLTVHLPKTEIQKPKAIEVQVK